jgi:hypothetical protein
MNDLAENAFGHRAATNIARANEKNGLHQKVWEEIESGQSNRQSE